MRILPVLFVVGALLAAVPVQAQWGWGRGGGYHASTAAEGYQRGMADVVRSAGAANLMNSAAMGNVEDARTKYIDNQLRATQVYFEKKRYNKEYRDANAKPRPTSEQLFRLAKEKTPGTLAAADLDPVSGGISWPDVLKMEKYDDYRANLEALYADAAAAGGKVEFDQVQQIRENVDGMQKVLAEDVRAEKVAPQTFSQANAFLKKLQYTATKSG